jgi:hypothetical protein
VKTRSAETQQQQRFDIHKRARTSNRLDQFIATTEPSLTRFFVVVLFFFFFFFFCRPICGSSFLLTVTMTEYVLSAILHIITFCDFMAKVLREGSDVVYLCAITS